MTLLLFHQLNEAIEGWKDKIRLFWPEIMCYYVIEIELTAVTGFCVFSSISVRQMALTP